MPPLPGNYTRTGRGRTTALDLARNVGLGEDQRFARHKHDPFIGAATGRWRQFRDGGGRDVNADDGEITGLELKNVGASVDGDCSGVVGVRIRADSAAKFNWRIHAAQQSAKRGKNARTKYSAYTVVRICGFGFIYGIVKTPKHRKILGENIRMHRRAMKWSQEKLAEKADLHHNYIGDIERGEENVSVDALMRIATALKVRLSDLVREA